MPGLIGIHKLQAVNAEEAQRILDEHHRQTREIFEGVNRYLLKRYGASAFDD